MSFLKWFLIDKRGRISHFFGVIRAVCIGLIRLCVSAAIIIRQFMACAGFFSAAFVGSQHVGFCMKKLENQP